MSADQQRQRSRLLSGDLRPINDELPAAVLEVITRAYIVGVENTGDAIVAEILAAENRENTVRLVSLARIAEICAELIKRPIIVVAVHEPADSPKPQEAIRP